MATRGPDGRRFPWGNAREPGWRRAVSPWGLAGPLRTAEWVDVDGAMLAACRPPTRGLRAPARAGGARRSAGRHRRVSRSARRVVAADAVQALRDQGEDGVQPCRHPDLMELELGAA